LIAHLVAHIIVLIDESLILVILTILVFRSGKLQD
jgi:hypothetical protein